MVDHPRIQTGCILGQVRPRLEQVLGSRLRNVVVYGSEARGESAPDSDIDLIVLLDGPVDLARDIDTIVNALYPLQLQIDRPIHVLPVRADSFEAGKFALYRNAKREGAVL